MHGGTPLSLEGQRRTMHRTIRMAIRLMQRCQECQDIPLKEVRCTACAWSRGAAMGIAGFAEVLGWEKELVPYMQMIGEFDPGWQKRVM